MNNIKTFIQEEKLNMNIRNLVEAAMVVTEHQISMTNIMMHYSAFLQTTKEGERVLPVWLFVIIILSL